MKKQINVIHKGSNGCMNIAFYLKPNVAPGQRIQAKHVTLLNKRKPQPGDPIICGSCGKTLYTVSHEGWAK